MPIGQISGFSKVRIMTSIFISAIIIAMGFLLMSYDLTEPERNLVMIMGAILVIINLVVPTIWAFMLAKKQNHSEEGEDYQ